MSNNICFGCGAYGEIDFNSKLCNRCMKKQGIEVQRDLITKKLQTEFTDEQIAFIWTEINELIELELNYEEECNK